MSSPTFWTSLASYCQELAPVAGPLLSAVGETAAAVDRVNRGSTTLRGNNARLRELLSAEDE
jgi:hypothetical protein